MKWYWLVVLLALLAGAVLVYYASKDAAAMASIATQVTVGLVALAVAVLLTRYQRDP